MKHYKIIFVTLSSMFFFGACVDIPPPHVVVGCKITYDTCMIKNTFEGPLRSHDICMNESKPECRKIP